ncbi:MAG TPA: prepilin-type N-terminal cleavage/methylation domain-containing protein [Chthonomonadaceae bacterium]|nr:prepilin-type N-terminal cleavage/methylation domain-containing protein [Chthonomonadaceae bacterium]
MMRTDARNRNRTQSRRRGLTMIELLAAVLMVSIAAAGAAATWTLASRVVATKRITEMGAYVALQQMDRLKARKYSSLAYTAEDAPLVDWYDKNGQWLGNSSSSPAVTTGYFQTKSWVRQIVNRDATTNTEDLAQVEVRVLNTAGTRTYEDIYTLLTFGGI